jgi:ABC-type multidrug transport system fused ATPase/permease subunit
MTDGTTPTWQAVDHAWRDQATWSKVASGRKQSLQRWRFLAATGGVAGAILETGAAGLPEGGLRTTLAIVGGLILVAVSVVVGSKLSTGQVREWAEARSASEALKTEIFKFLAGARPYGPERNAEALANRAREIEEKIQNLNVDAANVQVTPTERLNRPISAAEYIAQRVNDQAEWFRRKARSNSTAAISLRNAQFVLALAAAIIGFLASGSIPTGVSGIPSLGPWVAVVTTIGAAVAAYLAAERFQEQAVTYYAAARRLEGIRAGWTDKQEPKTPERFAALVDASEGAISAASEGWLADWSREEAKPATA